MGATVINYIRPTTSILTAILNNAEQLGVRRIVQSESYDINHASDNRVWYIYTSDTEGERIICIAETYIIGTGDRLFSVRNIASQLTNEEERQLLEYTANGILNEKAPALTALSMDELSEVLEGYTSDNQLGMINQIHPRLLVGDALDTTARSVKSVSLWDGGIRLRLRSGVNIFIDNATVDPYEPHDILFKVTIDENKSYDQVDISYLDAKELCSLLPSYVYYNK